jgi:hypothetical protein
MRLQDPDDGYNCFRRLTDQLHKDNFGITASRIDSLLHSAWTTGSELIGELGLEILDFEKCGYDLNEQLQSLIDDCMRRVRQVWPDIGHTNAG